MNKKDIARSVGIGTAALLGLAAPGCHHPKPVTPPPVTSPASEPATAETPATVPATTEPATPAPDCNGKDKFTDACGYPSPTRYAVLDPKSIVNG